MEVAVHEQHSPANSSTALVTFEGISVCERPTEAATSWERSIALHGIGRLPKA